MKKKGVEKFSEFLGKRMVDITIAVLKLADRFGIKGITTKRIANEVGFNEGALYKHIKSKSEIYKTILDVSEKLIEKKFLELKESDFQPDEKLREWFIFSINFLEEFPGIYRIVFSDELYVDERKLFEKFKKVTFNIKRNIEEILEEGVEKSVFKKEININNSSILYLGVIHTSFTLWNIFERKSVSLKEIGSSILGEYLKLIKKEVL